MDQSVVGIVHTCAEAQSLIDDLKSVRFSDQNISILLPDREEIKAFTDNVSAKAKQDGVVDVDEGGIVGGIFGLTAGVGAMTSPDAGPFIAAGPIMSLLNRRSPAAAFDGLTSVLMAVGFPESEANLYAGKVRGHSILIAAHYADIDQRKRAEDLFVSNKATDIHHIGSDSCAKNYSSSKTF